MNNMKDRKIGLEYEFLAIQIDNGHAASRGDIKAIWRSWAEQEHVELYIDYATKQPVGVWFTQPDGEKMLINTDGGICIVEFGFLPFSTLQETEENMRVILKEFLVVARQHGVALIDTGLQPKTPTYHPDLKSEKIWYRPFMRHPHWVGYHHLFHNIAAHQVCIDVSYDELVDVLNLMNGIGGVTIALFANSGFGEWEVKSAHSERELRWNRIKEGSKDTFEHISGLTKEPLTSLADYISYSWRTPLQAIHRGKTLHSVNEFITIGDYFKKSQWDAFDHGAIEPSTVSPSVKDINDQAQYFWPQSRAKFWFDESRPLEEFLSAYAGEEFGDYGRDHVTKLYVETRNIGAQPWNEVMVAPAFLLGLIENLEEAKKIVDDKPWKYWIELREKTLLKSMEVDEVVPIAQTLFSIAKQGLVNRGRGEEKYIEPLVARIEKRQSPAMRSIEEYRELGMDNFIKKRTINL